MPGPQQLPKANRPKPVRRNRQPRPRPATPGAKRVTLDRLLSKLGLASRSTAQAWIREGRVAVDRRIVRQPDTWVSWPGDTVSLDDQPLRPETKRLILFHKPKGVVTTHRDEKGRTTIFDTLPAELGSLHAVGRLDQATSGLLLLTNDTSLSSFLTDPTNRVPRVYLVTVRGELTDDEARRATAGLSDKGEQLRCDLLTIQKRSGRESHLEVTLTEGKNREVRRLFDALGHEVTRLRRIRFGPFTLGDLPPGAWREVPLREAAKLLPLAADSSHHRGHRRA